MFMSRTSLMFPTIAHQSEFRASLENVCRLDGEQASLILSRTPAVRGMGVVPAENYPITLIVRRQRFPRPRCNDGT